LFLFDISEHAQLLAEIIDLNLDIFGCHFYGLIFLLDLHFLHGLLGFANLISSFCNRVVLTQLLIKHTNDVFNFRYLSPQIKLLCTHVTELAHKILVFTIVFS